MTWPQFVANYAVNDYAVSLKRHGPCPAERLPLVHALLSGWFLGAIPSHIARAGLRRAVRP